MTATQLSAADRAALIDEPWLELYLFDGDAGLDPARARFERANSEAWREVRSQRLDVYQRAYTKSGLMTTSFNTLES